MEIAIEPGNYVLAVSGGVDSVVLLDLLSRQPDVQLTVAHYDHGIRPDSADDATFVANLAQQYDLPFVAEQGNLGPAVSEAIARNARYAFLRTVQKTVKAQAIITAHHQDDALETAVLNLLRGTSRRGLTSLRSTADIKRPLLDVPKVSIVTYAAKHNLSWHEDSTNHDQRYTRNYIRHRLLVRFNTDARQQLCAIIEHLRSVNAELDELLAAELASHAPGKRLEHRWFIGLPHTISTEVMAAWLRQNRLADFDHRTIDRLTIAAKTKPIGKQLDVLHGVRMRIEADYLALELAER